MLATVFCPAPDTTVSIGPLLNVGAVKGETVSEDLIIVLPFIFTVVEGDVSFIFTSLELSIFISFVPVHDKFRAPDTAERVLVRRDKLPTLKSPVESNCIFSVIAEPAVVVLNESLEGIESTAGVPST